MAHRTKEEKVALSRAQDRFETERLFWFISPDHEIVDGPYFGYPEDNAFRLNRLDWGIFGVRPDLIGNVQLKKESADV